MAPDEVIKTLVMGITIAVLANQVFRVPGEHWTNISMVNSLLDSLLVSVSALVSAAFAFPVLRIAGGHGSFRNTFVGAALIAAVLSPSFALIQGAAVALHLRIAHDSWQPAVLAFVISAMIYAPIHDLPWRRAVIALFSPLLLLFLLIVFYFRA